MHIQAAVTYMRQEGAVQGVRVSEDYVSMFFNVHSVVVSCIPVTSHCTHRQHLSAFAAALGFSVSTYDGC